MYLIPLLYTFGGYIFLSNLRIIIRIFQPTVHRNTPVLDLKNTILIERENVITLKV